MSTWPIESAQSATTAAFVQVSSTKAQDRSGEWNVASKKQSSFYTAAAKKSSAAKRTGQQQELPGKAPRTRRDSQGGRQLHERNCKYRAPRHHHSAEFCAGSAPKGEFANTTLPPTTWCQMQDLLAAQATTLNALTNAVEQLPSIISRSASIRHRHNKKQQSHSRPQDLPQKTEIELGFMEIRAKQKLVEIAEARKAVENKPPQEESFQGQKNRDMAHSEFEKATAHLEENVDSLIAEAMVEER